MKVYKHFRNIGAYPPHDQLNFICDWDQFENDPRTQQVELHLGSKVDFSRVNPEKINVHMWGEWPNAWFCGRTRGSNVPHNVQIEQSFDYVASYCHMTNFGRKDFGNYIFVPPVVEFDYMNRQLGFDMSSMRKEIDVFMCAGTGDPKLKVTPSGCHPVEIWYDAIKEYDHKFCNQNWPSHFVSSWHEKQLHCAQSKVAVVFASFIGSTLQCREFSGRNFPWLKFKKEQNCLDDVKPCTPAAKYRIHDAALCKSVMLCYRDPFHNDTHPYRSAIESIHGLTPGVDFIYFDNAKDLQEKIEIILGDYDNPRYEKMVDSAYNKLVNNYTTDVWYEKYMVPLSSEGKTK